MELRTFIKETLCQIIDGVNDARAEKGGDFVAPIVTSELGTSREGIARAREGRHAVYLVSFDVAVIAEERKEQGAKAGIAVLGLGGADGSTATSQKKENVSRIQFKVPVALNTS
jgi:hypothetical protein